MMDKFEDTDFCIASQYLQRASQSALLIFWSNRDGHGAYHREQLGNSFRAAAAELGFDIALSGKAKDDGH